MSEGCRRFRFLWHCLACAGLVGCTSVPASLHEQHPVKVLTLESPMAVDPDRLRKVLAPDASKGSPAADVLIRRGRQHAQESALAAMDAALAHRPGFELIAPPAQDDALAGKIRDAGFAGILTQDEADRLHATTGADAVLRFGITDYGLTPNAWRNGYITFEATTTLALAAIIAYPGTLVAKAAAGTYLAEETVEETTEGYAGFWSLDVVCRPVRVEAELIRLNPVGLVWQTADTGLSGISLSRLTRKVAPAERNMQLDQATAHAAGDIVASLPPSLWNISQSEQGKP